MEDEKFCEKLKALMADESDANKEYENLSKIWKEKKLVNPTESRVFLSLSSDELRHFFFIESVFMRRCTGKKETTIQEAIQKREKSIEEIREEMEEEAEAKYLHTHEE